MTQKILTNSRIIPKIYKLFLSFLMNMKIKTNLLIICFLLSSHFDCHASGIYQYPEKFYQSEWCTDHNGQVEYILPDKTRCDCLTDEYALEFDFGPKWAEAIGQALHYSLWTSKKSGIVLILENKTDNKYWIRLNDVIDHFKLPIKTWTMRHPNDK